VLERPQVFVRVGIQVNTAGATIMAFSGTPMASAFVGSRTLTAGFQSVVLSGAAVQTLVVPSGAAVQSISGLDAAAAEDPSWQLVELVGLPVGPDWAGVFDLGVKQGLVGTPLPPPDAALDRYRRGAPFYGWEQQITATVAAPPWVLADPKAMLKVMRDGMLDPLKQMVTTLAPHDHATFSVKHSLAPAGGSGGDPAVAQFHPLQTLVFGASTDPLASLVSGFGTAFVDQDLPSIVLGNQTLFGDPDRSDWDYMVTARYAKGADGRSAAAEYAAIVFAPAVASPPPVPANLATANDGLKGPPQADEDWRGVVRVTWDKLADTLPFRVGSYALARARQAPAARWCRSWTCARTTSRSSRSAPRRARSRPSRGGCRRSTTATPSPRRPTRTRCSTAWRTRTCSACGARGRRRRSASASRRCGRCPSCRRASTSCLRPGPARRRSSSSSPGTGRPAPPSASSSWGGCTRRPSSATRRPTSPCRPGCRRRSPAAPASC
jgi:hypothetical protein